MRRDEEWLAEARGRGEGWCGIGGALVGAAWCACRTAGGEGESRLVVEE